jgi:hypothetical protein
MNLTQFKECMRSHKEFYDTIDNLINVLGLNDHIEIGDELANNFITLLEDYFQDTSEWIYYWIYELNYGKDYRPGMITIDGGDYRLETEEDLYNLLMENKNAN